MKLTAKISQFQLPFDPFLVGGPKMKLMQNMHGVNLMFKIALIMLSMNQKSGEGKKIPSLFF